MLFKFPREVRDLIYHELLGGFVAGKRDGDTMVVQIPIPFAKSSEGPLTLQYRMPVCLGALSMHLTCRQVHKELSEVSQARQKLRQMGRLVSVGGDANSSYLPSERVDRLWAAPRSRCSGAQLVLHIHQHTEMPEAWSAELFWTAARLALPPDPAAQVNRIDLTVWTSGYREGLGGGGWGTVEERLAKDRLVEFVLSKLLANGVNLGGDSIVTDPPMPSVPPQEVFWNLVSDCSHPRLSDWSRIITDHVVWQIDSSIKRAATPFQSRISYSRLCGKSNTRWITSCRDVEVPEGDLDGFNAGYLLRGGSRALHWGGEY